MAQPTPYSRQYNFTNYQTVHPSDPLPAAQVDLELNTIKATLDQTINNLRLIQRDDTALANHSVGIDQLKPEVTIGVNAPSPWVTSHSYVANDTVTTGGKFYLCLVSHTSGTFATDLAAGDWSLIADFTSISFDLSTGIHSSVAKTIPNDSDEFVQADSAASWGLKKTTWANFKSAMFTAWGALMAAGTGKTTPVDADSVALMDSAAGNATKVLTWANLKAGVLGTIGTFIFALTGKTTPVGADSLVIQDSAASNAPKQLTFTNLWAATLAAFGPLIAALTAKTTPVDSDGIMLVDSAASSAPKWITFTQMWLNYFKVKIDVLYLPLSGAKTVTGGFAVTPFSGGTVSSGTFTPAPANGNYQYYTNNGAHTLAAPASDCAIDILITNGASAGAVTFSGFTVGSATGSSLTTTNGNKFIVSIRRINSVATYSIYALQENADPQAI